MSNYSIESWMILLYSTDNRRMSERDPKAMMAHAQQLPNSKSVPALHHVGNSGEYTTHETSTNAARFIQTTRKIH